MNNGVDIVKLLKAHGYGVVEGADAVRAKIKELGNVQEHEQQATGETVEDIEGLEGHERDPARGV